jgi:hypothetical protein
MDGAPVRGESIPIRLFLAGYDLTPTMRDINKKFSVRYYLNLVLVDEEERRYFKQQVRESQIITRFKYLASWPSLGGKCFGHQLVFLLLRSHCISLLDCAL